MRCFPVSGAAPGRLRAALLRPALLVPLLLTAACGDAVPPPSEDAGAALPPSLQTAASAPTVVRLDDEAAAALRIETVTVQPAAYVHQLTLPGEVLPAPEHYALVSAPISGRVVRIDAHEGEQVRRGQPLLALESLEFAGLAAEYLQARAESAYQQTQVDRLATLVERKISPRSALEKAQADLARAQTSVSATYARLKAVGVPDAVLEGWSTTSRERPLLQIYAPLSGTIDRHDIELGQAVTAYQEMLSIIDPRRVLVRGFVSPDDAGFIASGDTVFIEEPNRTGAPIRARITTVNPALDAANKSIVVNILTDTRDGRPIPGQNVRLRIQTGTARLVLMLPLSAVQYDGNRPNVFVQRGPNTYEQRTIVIERVDEEAVVVAAGLEAGETVAVSQIFSLKALSRFEQYGEE